MTELLRTVLPGLPPPKIGKVREVYDLPGGRELLIVATDRISAFDATMANGIPGKGAILTRMSAWAMERAPGPNHLVTVSDDEVAVRLGRRIPELAGRATVARKARPFPVECVARGYLAGSLWKEYLALGPGGGTLHGHRLPGGMREAERLEAPIFTPATKADEGHDENVAFEAVVATVGAEVAEELRARTMALYEWGVARAAKGGLILADTKFEFGLGPGGILLIDETFTPDSSRYWDAALYAPGQSPPSFDKQYVRDFLERSGWDKLPPGPPLPDDVRDGTRLRYEEAFRRFTA